MQCSCILVLLFYLTVVYASKLQCGHCPSGFFLKNCKNNTTPNCEQCPEDSFKKGLNSVTQCTRCSGCFGRNNIEINKCNRTHDSECRCKKDYWYDTGLLFCAKCSSCRRGKGVLKNCSVTADTKCKKCVRGVTFSPVNSRYEACRPCKKCGVNEELVNLCTRRRDTVCKPIPVKKEFQLKNKSKWPDNKKTTLNPSEVEEATLQSTTREIKTTELRFVPTTFTMNAIKKDNSEASDDSLLELLLIVAGGVLGILFLVVLVLLIIRKRRKTTHPQKTRTQVVSPPSPAYEPKTVDRLSSLPLMQGSTDKLLRDVRYSLIEELSSNLNPKGRWKTLAGKLGFSSKDIENFELEPTNATATMLSHWAHNKHSTLLNLHDALKSLKWSVEADLVAKYLC